MSHPVQLYVYDLSRGLAKQMSMQLTGRQIDGVWHTSIVVFGKEVYYGAGIMTTKPGTSHHGQPYQVVDMGETDIDEETFDEYINQMREHYTADKYHLLDFNCNSFTNDCVAFLTGGSIPSFIKDLPADFLSTPFGAALRPTIDNMFRRPTPGAATPAPVAPVSPQTARQAVEAAPDASLAATLIGAIGQYASQRPQTANGAINPAYTNGAANGYTGAPTLSTLPPLPAVQGLTGPIHPATSPASFRSLLSSHRAVVAFFTSAGCPPCRMIEPAFESLAQEKSAQYNSSTTGSRGGEGGRVAFVKVDLGVGMGTAVGSGEGVRVTPTFGFYLHGKKIHELKGANAPELRTQTDLLLYEAFPPHRHTRLELPQVALLAKARSPILYTQTPGRGVQAVMSKLMSFIPSGAHHDARAVTDLKEMVIWLDDVYPSASEPQQQRTKEPPTAVKFQSWLKATRTISAMLPAVKLFPLADLWRLALLQARLAPEPALEALQFILEKAKGVEGEGAATYIATALKVAANAFSITELARNLVRPSPAREALTPVLVHGLLFENGQEDKEQKAADIVRRVAAAVAFDVAGATQEDRQSSLAEVGDNEDQDAEWEVELVSVLVEALGRESALGETVHRLTAALALLLYRAPSYETQVEPLLQVLQVRDVLLQKLNGDDGDARVEGGKKESNVKALVQEVALKLCP